MKLIKILSSYGYPVLHRPWVLKSNACVIVTTLQEHYKGEPLQFIGTGTSGAMIMASISIVPDCPYSTFGILKKRAEETHRGDITDFNHDHPAVVIDDQTSSGDTMERISTGIHTDLRNKVEVVIANGASYRQELLKKLFPNLKLILY